MSFSLGSWVLHSFDLPKLCGALKAMWSDGVQDGECTRWKCVNYELLKPREADLSPWPSYCTSCWPSASPFFRGAASECDEVCDRNTDFRFDTSACKLFKCQRVQHTVTISNTCHWCYKLLFSPLYHCFIFQFMTFRLAWQPVKIDLNMASRSLYPDMCLGKSLFSAYMFPMSAVVLSCTMTVNERWWSLSVLSC